MRRLRLHYGFLAAPAPVWCRLVTILRVAEAATLLGVSEDTVRRWAEAGRLQTTTLPSGRLGVDGRVLAAAAQQMAEPVPPGPVVAQSARNRFRGIVTKVVRDGVMAQVELQAGPFRVVSLMSSEAADELGLEPGVVAVASVKSTNVVVEIPESH
jgi:molybdopterin-binding protein